MGVSIIGYTQVQVISSMEDILFITNSATYNHEQSRPYQLYINPLAEGSVVATSMPRSYLLMGDFYLMVPLGSEMIVYDSQGSLKHKVPAEASSRLLSSNIKGSMYTTYATRHSETTMDGVDLFGNICRNGKV